MRARDRWEPWMLLDARIPPWDVAAYTFDELSAVANEVAARGEVDG